MHTLIRVLAMALVPLVPVAPAVAAEVFHGALYPIPGRGRLDPAAGTASLTSGKWLFTLDSASNGLALDVEPVQIFFGELDKLTVPAGAMRSSKSGKRFTYQDPATTHGIRKLRMWRQGDRRWALKVSVVGIDLSPLVTGSSICQSIALIVGDDDGFQGVTVVRPPGQRIPRVKITGACQPEDWPWL